MIHRVGRRIRIRICDRCKKEIINRKFNAKYCKECGIYLRSYIKKNDRKK